VAYSLSSQEYGNNSTDYETRNTAVGYFALYTNNPSSTTNGKLNTAVGSHALYSNTTGYENVSVGVSAGYNFTTGFRNTAIGTSALNNMTTGDYNTAVGYISGPSTTRLGNTMCLGNGASVATSNYVRIGNGSINSITGNVSFTSTSDGRFKHNIREDVPGLDFILKLRPLTYYFDLHEYNNFIGENDDTEWEGKYDIEKIKFTGFIAQEVEQAATAIDYDFSGVDKAGMAMGLRYSEFVVPLVKAIQEQQALIEALQKEIAEMKNERKKE